ncbi:DUF3899 domain-containing protein [Planococcus sp. PAMC 21323]|uniref:DUF3899 domain-containing protein n=1 Tax=Planococcus sp. PAMC 21323 TaxID=1526927 RepID=UPI0005702FDB|nr:DUF3899 domain-containing protein [Planococcus sp. PAMC 21323]
MNFKLILFFVSLSISFVLPFLLYEQWTLATWFDALFLIGLLLMMIYSGMILIEGEFFSAFLKSTRNFFAKTNKKDQLIRESEKRSLESVSFRREFPHRSAFLQIGLLFSIGSLLVSSAIYFLS